MIDQLKHIFPSLVIYDKTPYPLNDNYQWYRTKESQIIGIQKNELDDKNKTLLTMLFKPLHHQFPVKTEKELQWEKWLNDCKSLPDFDMTFRFVYFSIPNNQMVPAEFKEAIEQLFVSDVVMLWENEQEGIIVEIKEESSEDTIPYNEIIDILMSDLYVKIRFFVGPYLNNVQQLSFHYGAFLQGAKRALTSFDKNVIFYSEVIPMMVLDQTAVQFKEEMQHIILQEYQNDEEFLQMIEVFLASNLNISVAAKKLYMHRNSLQYRIDKFNERTGIDIREFQQALTVYLAILSKKTH